MSLFGNIRIFIRCNSSTKWCVDVRRYVSTGKIAFLPRKPASRRVPKYPSVEVERPRIKQQDMGKIYHEQSGSHILTEGRELSTNSQNNKPSSGSREIDDDDTIYVEFDDTNDLKTRKKNPTNTNNKTGQSAKDAAMDARGSLQDENISRKKNVGFDSKGFKVYSHTVQDLKRLPAGLVTSILKSSIIFNEGDILAIDKPYGLPCHGGPGVVNNIEELLPRLARMLPGQQEGMTLRMVHRLDKETTGVMLLAKTEKMQRKLHEMFRNHEIVKKYWLITVGVPEPREGIIDIPMIEKEVEGKHRMALKPDIGAVYKDLWQEKNRSLGTKSVSRFKVLYESDNSALVEVQAVTGIKHQVRCHMAFGLGCPILGDHKYSHFNKIAPQRLPTDMLRRLKLRQAKVRTMPMHLHAHQIIIPDIFKGRNLSIKTRLPRFFNKNLASLKLKVG